MIHAILSTKQNLHAPEYEIIDGVRAEYSDSPHRYQRILAALQSSNICTFANAEDIDFAIAKSVHGVDMLDFLQGVWEKYSSQSPANNTCYPYVFAPRSNTRLPRGLVLQFGYYCFDAETPIQANTWAAALSSAGCAFTAAKYLKINKGDTYYALCRPPGHHSGKDFFGGYCYLNNIAVAAKYLSADGRIAILDLDCHHGNGTQDIFYDSPKVLYCSLHADPNYAYPFFWGYPEEIGTGEGIGLNINLPLPIGCDDRRYLATLEKSLHVIAQFRPLYLLVSLGLDIHKDDPQSHFNLSEGVFSEIGESIKSLRLPTLIVQEGGYNLEKIGSFVVSVLEQFA